MSAELAEALRAQGKFSQVASGYILVGMAAAGEDVSGFLLEIYPLLGEELPQGLRAALTSLVEGRLVGVVPVSDICTTLVLPPQDDAAEAEFDSWPEAGFTSPAPAVASDDPFDDVGFDFK